MNDNNKKQWLPFRDRIVEPERYFVLLQFAKVNIR